MAEPGFAQYRGSVDTVRDLDVQVKRVLTSALDADEAGSKQDAIKLYREALVVIDSALSIHVDGPNGFVCN
jgi:hypothetical protein